MTRFHYVVPGIILLTLFLTVGFVCAAETDTNLSVSKIVSSAAPYETDHPITWTVSLTNNGPADATNISLVENISGFSGAVTMSGVPDQGTYNNDTRIWNISRLDNATSIHLTIVTVFGKAGDPTNNADLLRLDQTSYGTHHADASVHVVINNAGAVIPDQPLKVNLTIRPNTLNLNSKGVFSVFVTLNGGDSLLPSDMNKKSVDIEDSSLVCDGAEMINAGLSNKNGGTLIAKFHRQDLENITTGPGLQINCSGTISVNGKPFNVEGSDTIRVIGEKKGMDKVISGLMKFLGLEKDDIAVNETEDGNITISITLDPDSFKNNGQMKKADRITFNTTAPAGTVQNDSDKSDGQDILKNNGRDKDNNGKGNNFQESNSGNKNNEGNKNTTMGNDESNGKSNGKKNK